MLTKFPLYDHQAIGQLNHDVNGCTVLILFFLCFCFPILLDCATTTNLTEKPGLLPLQVKNHIADVITTAIKTVSNAVE